MSNFSIFFPSGQKNLSGLGQMRVSLLFTAGQKYARVGWEPISRFIQSNISQTLLKSFFT